MHTEIGIWASGNDGWIIHSRTIRQKYYLLHLPAATLHGYAAFLGEGRLVAYVLLQAPVWASVKATEGSSPPVVWFLIVIPPVLP